MKAWQTMTREVVTAAPELSLRAAWAAMRRHGFRHVPVVAGGRLKGILSDRDVLLFAQWKKGEVAVPKMTVGDAMTLDPVTCGPEASVGAMALMMLERKIDALPITDREGRLLGLVTSSDLLGLLTPRDHSRALPFNFRLKLVDSRGRVAAA